MADLNRLKAITKCNKLYEDRWSLSTSSFETVAYSFVIQLST